MSTEDRERAAWAEFQGWLDDYADKWEGELRRELGPPTANAQPRDERGRWSSEHLELGRQYRTAYDRAFGEGSKKLGKRERAQAVKEYKEVLARWEDAGRPPHEETGTPTLTKEQVHAAAVKHADHGQVALTDLHDALGRPDLGELHAHIQQLRREGKLEGVEHEGRYGITPREEETAITEPSSRGHPARITAVRVK